MPPYSHNELPQRLQDLAPKLDVLLRDKVFMDDLDALSERVIIQASDLIHDHLDLWKTTIPELEAEEIITLVVGWILGMPAGSAAPDKRVEIGHFHMILAAYVSGVSQANARRVMKRSQH